MAAMKEKPHYNKTHYYRCQTKAIPTVYREMSQENKDIVEEMGFGALANVPEMNVSNTLLKELLDRFDEEKGCLKTLKGKIYITLRKVAAALSIGRQNSSSYPPLSSLHLTRRTAPSRRPFRIALPLLGAVLSLPPFLVMLPSRRRTLTLSQRASPDPRAPLPFPCTAPSLILQRRNCPPLLCHTSQSSPGVLSSFSV
ncbi:uncharacterized protein DS421_14g466830 [Arachis hypogaea]|nr:uncharacterized protein DS421_14g466830 [Arachis hypogaea]